MLSPLSADFKGSSAGDGNDAITFMSGSAAASGATTIGSSPGSQRAMPSAGAPSEELPKNRLAVFTENPSRGAAGSSAIVVASGAAFRSSSGWDSGDIETSNCASGGALSAAANSGSSGTCSLLGAASEVLAP